MHREFLDYVVEKVKPNPEVVGVAVGGSFITGEVDEFSDVDLILITENRIAPDKEKMMAIAKTFGDFISGFTGEHVGEPLLLICLFDNPLLHVDIKFLTPAELTARVEDPLVLWERGVAISSIIAQHPSSWPMPDYQWIEDRFWIWIHYAALKLGRGEDLEAFEFLSFLRTTVLAPLLQIKAGYLPRGVRKVEVNLLPDQLQALRRTIAGYNAESIFTALDSSIELYRQLRTDFPSSVQIQHLAEARCTKYLSQIRGLRLHN